MSIGINKSKVVSLIVEKLQSDLTVANQAVKAAHERATHEETQAKSQYDTFALEASYLAHGQSKRAEELSLALGKYQSLAVRDFNDRSEIALTALVQLENEDGEEKLVFLGPDSGGLKITCDGKRVVIVTPNAPLGEALLGKSVGDSVEVQGDRSSQSLDIVAVK